MVKSTISHFTLEELVGHNENLVKTAKRLQAAVNNACLVIGEAIDCAEPIAEMHGDPVEYAIPAESIEAMRGVLLDVRAAGWWDK